MDQKTSAVCINERKTEANAIKLEVEKLYKKGEKKDICSRHYLPNNKYGYCPECEAEPDIRIRHCNKCNTRYAEHVSWGNRGFCDTCAAETVRNIVCKGGQ